VQIMIVLINKSILQIKLATQEKMICLCKFRPHSHICTDF